LEQIRKYKLSGNDLINNFELRPDAKLGNKVEDNWIPKRKDVLVEIQLSANDLRYCGFGVQSIFAISILFPDGSVYKTMRNTKDEDLQKCQDYVNKHLKKNGYTTVEFISDFTFQYEENGETPNSVIYNEQRKKGWLSEGQYRIKNIKKVS